MIRLVVNADDLGLHPGIDEGILSAHRDGIVTSATLVARGRTSTAAAVRAEAQGLALGLHLALTQMPPASDPRDVPTVAPSGRMRRGPLALAAALAAGRVRPDEIEREVRAQIDLARSLGARLDHLDGHQHVHLFPVVRGIVRRVAREEGLAVRAPSERPDARWIARPVRGAAVLAMRALGARRGDGVGASGIFDSGRLDEPRLLRLIAALPPGDHELVCHPGRGVDRVAEDPGWRYGWERELGALTSPRVRRAVKDAGIELTTYGAIAREPRGWYDRAASSYDRRWRGGWAGALRRREQRRVLEMLQPRRGERVLDAGCGAGFDAIALRDRGCIVLGVDTSTEMVRAARSRGVDAVAADIERLDLGRTFDKALCCGALEMCDDPVRALGRLGAHLPVGGPLVLLVAARGAAGRIYRRWHAGHGVHVRLFGRDDLGGILRAAGLRLLRWESPTPHTAVALAVRTE